MTESEILNSGLFQAYKEYKFFEFLNFKDVNLKDDLDLEIMAQSINMQFSREDIVLCDKLFRRFNDQVYHLRKRIKKLVLDHLGCRLGFLTLTFNDKILTSTSENTRRTYVSRYLKSTFPLGYIANIDYGTSTQREHYHAIVIIDQSFDFFFGSPRWLKCTKNGATYSVLGYDHIDWPYLHTLEIVRFKSNGSLTDKLKNEKETYTKLSKYLAKLTNHAIKESTCHKKLIYSKNTKDLNKVSDDVII